MYLSLYIYIYIYIFSGTKVDTLPRSGRGEDGSRVLADDYDPLAAMREELQAELDSHLDEAKQTWRDAESQLRRTLRENRRQGPLKPPPPPPSDIFNV